MTDEPLTPDELTRQLRCHLNSLKAQGIDWVFEKPYAITDKVTATPTPSLEFESSPKSTTNTPRITPVSTTAPAVPPTSIPAAAGPLATTPDLFFGAEEKQMDASERMQALEVLKDEVAGCTLCQELTVTRTQTVFGEGPLDADLCFIGEAPGANEDQQGRPFVGEAGQLLDKILKACGFEREQVYICNILRCRPPGNRTPLANEAANCRSHLERQLELIQPKWICTLGACASQHLLGVDTGIGRLRRRFHNYNGIPVLCTYHPAYLLRNPSAKRQLWQDMQLLLKELGRPIPGK